MVFTYQFKAYTHTGAYEFTIEVTAVPTTLLQGTTVQQNTNAVIYLGNVKVVTLTVNGEQVSSEDYQIKNNTLTLSAKLLTKENNTVVINDQTVTVNVVKIGQTEIGVQDNGGVNLGLIIGISAGALVVTGGVVTTVILIRRKKSGSND